MTMKTLRKMTLWALAALLGMVCPVMAADWGTDAGSIITIGGDSAIFGPGQGRLLYDGLQAVSLPDSSVVESVYNLSPLPTLPFIQAVPRETVWVPYAVENRGNCLSDISLALILDTTQSTFRPAWMKLYQDLNRNGLLDSAETEFGVSGAGSARLVEGESLNVLLGIALPEPAQARHGDTAAVKVAVRTGSGSDDFWPRLFKALAFWDQDAGDSQENWLYLAVNYGQIADFTVQPGDTSITADDSLVFTVTARDSGNKTWDISAVATFSVDKDSLGSWAHNVYHPAQADSQTVTITYGAITRTVRVAVRPGVLVRLDIQQNDTVISAAASRQYTVFGFDQDNNPRADTTTWSVTHSLLGTITPAGLFDARHEGSGWIMAAVGAIKDSVAIQVTDDIAPATFITAAPETVFGSSAVRILLAGADTTAGHVGTAPESLQYLYKLDSAAWETSAVPELVFYPLTDGPHQITVAARDARGNTDTLSPINCNFTVRLAPFTLPGNRWAMVSIPKDVRPRTITQIAATDSGAQVRLYRWNETLESDLFSLKYQDLADSALDLGAGYWLSGTGNLALSLDTAAHFAVNDTIDLAAGWNQIGASHSYITDWSQARFLISTDTFTLPQAVAAGKVEQAIYAYAFNGDTAGYAMLMGDSGVAMRAWEGYWLKANEPCRLVESSRPYFGVNHGPAKAVAARAGEWRVMLSAAAGNLRDECNFAGVVNGAQAGRDVFDVSEPPAMSPYVALSFNGNLGADFRGKLGDIEEWYFSVATDVKKQDMALSCDGTTNLPAGARAYLYDLSTGAVVNLKTTNAYRYTPDAGATRQFKLVVTRSLAFEPAPLATRLALTGISPNPFKHLTQVGFTVPAANQAFSAVNLAVYDVYGRTVKQLLASDLPAGSYSVTWDGTDDNGATLGNGYYFCRLSTGQESVTGRVEIVR
jgi:hypothetical protein